MMARKRKLTREETIDVMEKLMEMLDRDIAALEAEDDDYNDTPLRQVP